MPKLLLTTILTVSIVVLILAILSVQTPIFNEQTTSVTLTMTATTTPSEVVFKTKFIPTNEGILYEVTFFQTPTCQSLNDLYAIPWAVKLANSVIIEPTNATLDNDTETLVGIPGSGVPINQTRITFSVPDGDYKYVLAPIYDFSYASNYPLNNGLNSTGLVAVNGSDVSVNVTVEYPGKCGF